MGIIGRDDESIILYIIDNNIFIIILKKVHPKEDSLRINRCLYSDFYTAQRDTETLEGDCRALYPTMDSIYFIHYTECYKPWKKELNVKRGWNICRNAQDHWWEMYYRAEIRHNLLLTYGEANPSQSALLFPKRHFLGEMKKE